VMPSRCVGDLYPNVPRIVDPGNEPQKLSSSSRGTAAVRLIAALPDLSPAGQRHNHDCAGGWMTPPRPGIAGVPGSPAKRGGERLHQTFHPQVSGLSTAPAGTGRREHSAVLITPVPPAATPTTGRSTAPSCIPSCDASTPTWCVGSARSTGGCADSRQPTRHGQGSPPGVLACSRTGDGTMRSGDQDDKSRVTGDCHARDLWEPGDKTAPGHPTGY